MPPPNKAEFFRKKALDALLEMISDEDYATNQHHSDPEYTTQNGKLYGKGTELGEGASSGGVAIPPEDFHTSAEVVDPDPEPTPPEDVEDAEFFKESLTQKQFDKIYTAPQESGIVRFSEECAETIPDSPRHQKNKKEPFMGGKYQLSKSPDKGSGYQVFEGKKPIAHLQPGWFGVLPAYRGKGIGTELVRVFIKAFPDYIPDGFSPAGRRSFEKALQPAPEFEMTRGAKGRMASIVRKDAAADKLYHVTHTNKAEKIRKQGILPLQTSNWVRGGDKERYGEGEIFAFTHPEDAVRWAGKMDWEFYKSTGSGKISVVIFKPGKEEWKADTADPMSQASAKGKWMKAHAKIAPEQIINVVPVTIEMTRALVAGQPVKLGSIKEEFTALKRRWQTFYMDTINTMVDRNVTFESCTSVASSLRKFATKLNEFLEASPKGGLFGDAFIDPKTVSRYITVVLDRTGVAEAMIAQRTGGRGLDAIRSELMNAGDQLDIAFSNFDTEFYYMEADRTALQGRIGAKLAGQRQKFESLNRKWDALKKPFRQQLVKDIKTISAAIPHVRKFAEELLALIQSAQYTLLPNADPEQANITPSLREGLKHIRRVESAVHDDSVMREAGSTDTEYRNQAIESFSTAVDFVDTGFHNQAVQYYYIDKNKEPGGLFINRRSAATKSYGTGTPPGGLLPAVPPEDDPTKLDTSVNAPLGNPALPPLQEEEGAKMAAELEAEENRLAEEVAAEDNASMAKSASLAMRTDFSPFRSAAARLARSEDAGWFEKSARPSEQKIELLQKQFKMTPEQVELCVAADPSPNQSDYVAWLAKWVSKGQLRLPEDTDKIKGQLGLFTKLKRSPAFTHNKDIQQYDPGKLFEVLESGAAGPALSKKEQDREAIAKGSTVVVNDGGLMVYKVTDPKALALLSGGTNWCTAQDSMGEHYLKSGPSYVIFEDGSAFAQFHPASNQLMNRQDVCMLEKVYGEKSTSRGWGRSAPKGPKLIASFITDQTLLAALQKLSAVAPDVKEWVGENTSNPEELVKILGERATEEQYRNEHSYSYYGPQAKQYTMTVQHALASGQALAPEIEARLADSVGVDLLLKYGTKFHAGQAWDPLGKAILAQRGISKEIISYATKFLKARWPEGEAKLLKGALLRTYNAHNMKLVLEYAQRVVKARWPELEAKFHRAKPGEPSGYGSAEYAISILKQRWTAAGVKPRRDGKINEEEIIIIGAPDEATRYAATFMAGQRWPEYERTSLEVGHYAAMIDYAATVLKARMPELEEAILSGATESGQGRWDTPPDLPLAYSEKVLKARWPEYEQKVVEFIGKKLEKEYQGRDQYSYDRERRGYGHNNDLPAPVASYFGQVVQGRWPELEQTLLSRYASYPENWVTNQSWLDGYLTTLGQTCDRKNKKPGEETPYEDDSTVFNSRVEELVAQGMDHNEAMEQGQKERTENRKRPSFSKFPDDPCNWPEGEQRLRSRDENFEAVLLANAKRRGDEWHRDAVEKDSDKDKDWTNYKGFWISWYGNSEIEHYVQFLDATGQQWRMGDELMDAVNEVNVKKYGPDSWRGRVEKRVKDEKPEAAVTGSLLRRGAVEFHDAPKLKAPREQMRRHIDQEAEAEAMDGVMDGVKQPLNNPKAPPQPKQIDPRIKGDASSLLLRGMGQPTIAAVIDPEIVREKGNWKLYAWPAGTVQFGQYGEIKRPAPKGQVWYVGDKAKALPIMKDNWDLTHEQENQLLERGSLNLPEAVIRLTNVDYYSDRKSKQPKQKLLTSSLLKKAEFSSFPLNYEELSVVTDDSGTRWAALGKYSVSIPERIPADGVEDYARPRLAEQASRFQELRKRLTASRKSDREKAEGEELKRLMGNAMDEAYEAFLKEKYLLQEAQDRRMSMQELWNKVGQEYANEHFTSKHDRDPDDWFSHR
jgi:GNAT superfamily N-acetyltransferase